MTNRAGQAIKFVRLKISLSFLKCLVILLEALHAHGVHFWLQERGVVRFLGSARRSRD